MIPSLRPLTPATLLNVWDQGHGLTPARRALVMLAAASDAPFDALAALTVGERDTALLTLREWCFGARVESVAACPACGEQLELAFGVADVRAAPPSADVHELWLDGQQVRFRLPTAGDLLAMAEGAVTADAAHLLARCVVEGTATNGAGQAAIGAAMAAADPQADVRLALTCPACGHAWRAAFDILTFFWAEIDAWAWRTLREVHTLAQAYGWSEGAILALSPLRRQRYLELVQR